MKSQPSDRSPVPVGRWPVPSDAQSILIFGGTFDPPHRGHLELPIQAHRALGLDWLVFVPARCSPHKSEGPQASDDQRLAMLQAGLAGTDRTCISTLELERELASPSYTVETLREIRELVGPIVEMRLLIGADQAGSFARWKEPEEVRRLARPAVMRRAGREDELDDCWNPDIVDVPALDVSATEIRRLLQKGRPDRTEFRRLVPEPVLEVIRREGLYRSGS